MRRLAFLCVLLLVFGTAAQLQASQTNWLWVFTATSGANNNSGSLGVLTSAIDDQDSRDVQTNKNSKLKMGVYHSNWTKGSGNNDPYWSSDIRGAFPPGQIKKWAGFYLWKATSAGSSDYTLQWSPDTTNAPVSSIQGVPYRYYLTLLTTQAGGPSVGTRWELVPGMTNSIILPNAGYGASAGYSLDFEADPVPAPEPGMIVFVLGAGLPIGFVIRRLRR